MIPIPKRRQTASAPFALLSLAAWLAAGCMVKDKPDKPLVSGALVPPWDSIHFVPKRLEGYVYAGAESLFAVFRDIARIDSLAGESKLGKFDPQGVDTVRIHQLFDTGFVFPQLPEASMPYAYDDSFRDDTLYRSFFGNGLFIQDHPCAGTYVLSGNFLHPARWLKSGMKEEELVAALGKPGIREPGVLRYLTHFTAPLPDDGKSEYESFDVYEGTHFYFIRDSLFASVLQRSQPCH
jgi:hypothetical protein